MNHEPSDEQLIAKIQKENDQEALNALLFRYDVFTIKFVHAKLFSSRNQVYDQEEFIQLIRHATMHAAYHFDAEKGSFKNYWMAVATRSIHSELRRLHNKSHQMEMKQSYLLCEDEDDFLENLEGNNIHFKEEMQYEETMKKIQEVSRIFLSQQEKEVLFYHIYGYSYQEIAELLHIPLKTVDNHLVHIRKKMKQFL